jgi:hypothetical protein
MAPEGMAPEEWRRREWHWREMVLEGMVLEGLEPKRMVQGAPDQLFLYGYIMFLPVFDMTEHS